MKKMQKNMTQKKLIPLVKKIYLSVSPAVLDTASFTAREKAYLAGRLVKVVRLNFLNGGRNKIVH